MTTGAMGFQGRRLQEARLARGLFKNALGDMIGVTSTAISNYESGADSPQIFRVDMLAERLNFPREFFFSEPWQEEIELVHWRSRETETKSAREMTEQRMRWLCELFLYLDQSVDFPALSLPRVDVPDDFRLITAGHIEGAALAARLHWGLGEGPLPDTILALENAGIPVAPFTISSDKQDGFSFVSRLAGRPFVGLNLLDATSARARFDAAHELGHLILHRGVTHEQARSKPFHKIIEKQAHRFAGAFLFPKSSFETSVRHVSLDYLIQHKRRWGISIAAMISRAYDLNLIDDDEKTALFRSITRRGWRGVLREPFDDPNDMPIERPRMLRRAFEALVKDGVKGSSILSNLSLPQPEVEALAALEDGYLSTGSDLNVRLRGSRLSTVDLESGKVVMFPGTKTSRG